MTDDAQRLTASPLSWLRAIFARPTIQQLVRSRIFWAGLIFKLLLGSLVASTYLVMGWIAVIPAGRLLASMDTVELVLFGLATLKLR